MDPTEAFCTTRGVRACSRQQLPAPRISFLGSTGRRRRWRKRLRGRGAQRRWDPPAGATSDGNIGTRSSVTQRGQTPPCQSTHSEEESSLLFAFPTPPQEMDFSRPREQGSARGAGLAPVDVSSAVYPLLSHKSGILLPTPPLPSDQDPKNHHFLSACESLINSRQKGLIRKLFGKWKGRGRDGRWPQPVPLGGFAPRRHLPEPRAGPCLGVLKSAPATLPTPSGCRQSSPVDGYLSPCKDSAMKISVYIETFFLLLLFDHCPLAVPNPRHAGKHSRGILTRVSLEGTVGSVIGKGMCNMCCSPDPSAATASSPPFLPRRPRSSLHPPQALHTYSDTEKLHIWTS